MSDDVRNAGFLRTVFPLAMLMAMLSVGVGSAGAATLVVDKDGQQCRNADFQSISAAVAAARAGDKIKVCPDLYTEAVVVNKARLTLTATGRGSRDCFDASPAPADTTRDAIVTAPGSAGFDLQADRVTVTGFVVQGSTQGIRTGQAYSGHRVRRNLFQLNTLGAVFGGSGDRLSRLSHNCFRRNGSGPVGAGVFSAGNFGAELRRGRIDHNAFFQNNFAIRMGGGEDMRVDHNRSLLDNVFIRPAFTRALEISSNRIGEGGSSAISFFLNPAVPQANADAVVSHNVIEDRGGHGIVADASTLGNSLITGNRVTDAALDGINLAAGNTGNRVERNRTEGNGSDGIHAQGAVRNVFLRNRMFGNAEHDAHDDNRPANEWNGNQCRTDLPAGTICD